MRVHVRRDADRGVPELLGDGFQRTPALRVMLPPSAEDREAEPAQASPLEQSVMRVRDPLGSQRRYHRVVVKHEIPGIDPVSAARRSSSGWVR